MELSGQGMAGLTNSAINDKTGLDVITKTLSKGQEMSSQLASSAPAPSVDSINAAAGKGTRLDVSA